MPLGKMSMRLITEMAMRAERAGPRRPARSAFGGEKTDSHASLSWKVPKVGLEPTPSCEDRILSPARLPFRHFGLGQCQNTPALRRGQGVTNRRARSQRRFAASTADQIDEWDKGLLDVIERQGMEPEGKETVGILTSAPGQAT